MKIHYLWSNVHFPRQSIACGKRDPYKELLATSDRTKVTCTKCLGTYRFQHVVPAPNEITTRHVL